MKLFFNIVILAIVIMQFGCSKSVESTESGKSSVESASQENDLNIVKSSFDFKGLQLGQNENEFKKLFKGMVRTKLDILVVYSCSDESECSRVSGLTIANQIPEMADFYFHDKKLIRMNINFNQNYYEIVREALKKKYGDPIYISQTPLKYKFTGAEIIDENMFWENANGDKYVISNHDENGSSYIPKGMLILSSNSSSELIALEIGNKTESDDI